MAIDVNDFNEAFESYYRSLCFYCFGFIKDNDDAEDIVQDSFVALHQRMDRTEKRTIKAFLYITVANKSRNYFRHEKVVENGKSALLSRNKDYEQPVLDKMIQAEMMSLVYAEIEKMPPIRKKVFKMAWIDCLTNWEIVKKLNISIHTVKEHKGKGLAYMRSVFANLKIPDKT